MIRKLNIIKSDSLNPYFNQAIEASLLETVSHDSLILYIWANDKTVFIGKNQNAFTECNIQKLKESGGFLARRLSGGGAVYHDRGNLNFTFLSTKENYSLSRNFSILLDAVRSFGIEAQQTGRNDCTIDGKKFSGNAFYSSGDKCFHHGTVLINTMSAEIAKYLNVSNLKLAAKGVKSVVSRVTNLCEHNKDICYDSFSNALISSFIGYFSDIPDNNVKKPDLNTVNNVKKPDLITVNNLQISDLDNNLLTKWQNFFLGEERIMGDDIGYNFRLEQRFDWGLADIRLQLNDGIIEKVKIYTDSLEYDMTRKEKALIGKKVDVYEDSEISDILGAIAQKLDSED